MKYDDNYATCERTVIELRIYSESILPAEISQRMSIKPSSMLVKDQRLFTNLGDRQRIVKVNSWILSSEKHVESKDARRHLDWLLAQIEVEKDALLQIQRIDGVTMFVTCIWWSALGNGGPVFWPRQLRSLGALELEFEIDVAFFGTEPND